MPDSAALAKQPARPSIRSEQKRLTRERLLDGALSVFEEKGYVAATIDDIAVAAGASRATFYLHFKNQLDCIQTLFFERLEPDLATEIRKLDRLLVDGSRDDVRSWLYGIFRWFDDHRSFVLVIDQVYGMEREAARDMHLRYTEYLPELSERWTGEHALTGRLRVWLLVNLVQRVYLLWRVDGRFAEEVDVDMMVDALADLWTHWLRIPA